MRRDRMRSSVCQSAPPFVHAALGRLPGMIAVWAGFGVVAGVLAAPGAGPVAVVAGAVAGLIVLTPLGAALAVAGGKWRDSLAGGALGLALVPAAVWAGVSTGPSLAPVALVFGGTVGATVVTVCYRLPRLLLAAARPRVASGHGVEETVAV